MIQFIYMLHLQYISLALNLGFKCVTLLCFISAQIWDWEK